MRAGFRLKSALRNIRNGLVLAVNRQWVGTAKDLARAASLKPEVETFAEQGSGGGFEPGFNPGSNSRPSGGGAGGGGGGEQQHREPGFNLGSIFFPS